MLGTTVGGSSSKSDLEDNLNHEESYPLSEDKEALKNFQKMKGANEQSPLQDIENFSLKQSSTFSSKSPDEESTPSDEKLGSSATGNEATKSSAEQANGSSAFPFPPVNGNRESSVIAINQGSIAKSKDAIAIDIEPPVGNINKVPYITVTAPSNEGEHQKLGGTPPHEAMYSRSSNLPSVAITSEYMGNRSFCGDEETIRLNINLCNDKISNVLIDIKSCDDKMSNVLKKLADDKKSVLTKYYIPAAKLIFALLALGGYIANTYNIVHNATTERTSRHHAKITHTSPYNATIEYTSYNATIEYTSPPPGFTIGDAMNLAFTTTGLMIFLIYVFNTTFSWCEKKESSWKEELDSYIKEKDELKGELRHLQNRVEIDLLSQQVHEMSLQNQSYTEEIRSLREELSSFRESFSTQMNSVSTQQVVPGRDNVFNSPSTNCTHL